MPRSLVVGNGNLLICLDNKGYVRDFYYPYVGLENHVGAGCIHKVGVWVDGVFSWLEEEVWEIAVNSEKDTLIGSIDAFNSRLEVKIHFKDLVYNEKDVFIREVTVFNLGEKNKSIRIFFNQQFQIYGSPFADTAYYDPVNKVIVHYKGRRAFVINARIDNRSFDSFSIGAIASKGREGTYKDAEDGELSNNPVEHGFVDSVLGVYFDLEAKGKEQDRKTFHYFVVGARSVRDAIDLNEYVMEKTVGHMIRTTSDFWNAWVNKENFSFYRLDEDIVSLFKKSLLIIRAHTDNRGAIIASVDSDMLSHGKDTYGYMWPRDAAFAVLALDKAGYHNIVKRFFEFANRIISQEGYFLHKYNPDESLGSTWHPWVRDGNVSLPIQEDETALIIYSLWKHYEKSKDLEFIEELYNSLIKKAADFMLFYRDKKTGLPYPTYDLWEEKYGVSTFASSAIYGAFICAAKFAKLLGKSEVEREYSQAAYDLKNAILNYLYNKTEGGFYKMLYQFGSSVTQEKKVDASSFYGLFKFGILDVNDEKMKETIKIAKDKLFCKTSISGMARYEGDMYNRRYPDVPGNPWIITGLWLAQYYIANAHNEQDLEEVKKILKWTSDRALSSGVLSEQMDPYSGEQLSASPLTWSHAEFVVTVIEYLEKLEEFGISKVYK